MTTQLHFAACIMQVISCPWFEHGNVLLLLLYNAAIHSGGDAGNVEDYLWDTPKSSGCLSSYPVAGVESDKTNVPYPGMLHPFF
jgi:hypothetical protein